MENKDALLKDLIGKDEKRAQSAADFLINNNDIDLFKLLVQKSDFLFPFVRNNVSKRIENAVTKSNYENLINFFDYYSAYYDDLFASILAKHANENLTDEIFELLEKGTIDQKTYAAKYFSYIPDTVAIEALSQYAFCDDENLSANSAEALGQMQDDVSFDIALNNLNSDDDFDKLKAVKFFTAYGRNFPLKDIFTVLKTSKMPENIAGQIPYMESLLALLQSDYKDDTILAVFYIISGLGEILPLSDIFQFEMYEVLNNLINLNKSHNNLFSQIAVVLLSALSKFKMFCENDEYIFDEDKDTKYEINSVLKLLQNQSKDFWTQQKNSISALLNNKSYIFAALSIISEFNLSETADNLKELLKCDDEVVICEVLNTLKTLNKLDGLDLNSITSKIQNPNIKALIESSIK